MVSDVIVVDSVANSVVDLVIKEVAYLIVVVEEVGLEEVARVVQPDVVVVVDSVSSVTTDM